MERKRFDMEGEIASVDGLLTEDEKMLVQYVLKAYRSLDENKQQEMMAHVKYVHFADKLNIRNEDARRNHTEMYQ